ncbi:MAG: hypothetical protein NTW86_02905 [Candidatus Sumerlaeota bacterium]|nr:hypothetical protein [Candidatus Sumerlaeota bacterium]
MDANGLRGPGQLHRDLFVEDFADGQGDDGFPALLEERLDLGEGVAGEIEGDEEALRAILAQQDRLEGVDVGPARLVLLFHLDRVPEVHEIHDALFLLGGGGDGEDAPVDPHVADLGLIRQPAQGDDRPVLELERRDLAQLLLGPRQAADEESLNALRPAPRDAARQFEAIEQTIPGTNGTTR